MTHGPDLAGHFIQPMTKNSFYILSDWGEKSKEERYVMSCERFSVHK